MKTYMEFSPTAFDSKGLGLEDRQDWLVLCVSQTRDSGPLERSNFEIAKQKLSGASDYEDFEVHRFGHWGPGWFEVILVRPGSECETIARTIEERLDNCPILDENHFSELEHEEAEDIWQHCYTPRRRIEWYRKYGHEAQSWRDLLVSVRGGHFLGNAPYLVQS